MLKPGFSNNINIMSIGNGSGAQLLTDRAIDINGDGSKETASFTSQYVTQYRSRNTYSDPAGASRTVVENAITPEIERPIYYSEGV